MAKIDWVMGRIYIQHPLIYCITYLYKSKGLFSTLLNQVIEKISTVIEFLLMKPLHCIPLIHFVIEVIEIIVLI